MVYTDLCLIKFTSWCTYFVNSCHNSAIYGSIYISLTSDINCFDFMQLIAQFTLLSLTATYSWLTTHEVPHTTSTAHHITLLIMR